MHPNPAFRWDDQAAMRAFVAARGFAHLCVAGDGAPRIVHAPVIVTETGALRFHVARANRAADALDGALAVASVTGDDAYVSPDWYGSADQVPTWNYRAVEIEGRLRALDDEALLDQIDRLSAVFETALAPKPAWTRDKLAPARLGAMLRAIRAFELEPTAWRGTAKFGQNKSAGERRSAAAALCAIGRADVAALMDPA